MRVTKEERKQIIEYMKNHGVPEIECNLRASKIDNSGNIFAPEIFCFKCSYTDFTGKRRRFSFWPNTVGYQYY